MDRYLALVLLPCAGGLAAGLLRSRAALAILAIASAAAPLLVGPVELPLPPTYWASALMAWLWLAAGLFTGWRAAARGLSGLLLSPIFAKGLASALVADSVVKLVVLGWTGDIDRIEGRLAIFVLLGGTSFLLLRPDWTGFPRYLGIFGLVSVAGIVVRATSGEFLPSLLWIPFGAPRSFAYDLTFSVVVGAMLAVPLDGPLTAAGWTTASPLGRPATENISLGFVDRQFAAALSLRAPQGWKERTPKPRDTVIFAMSPVRRHRMPWRTATLQVVVQRIEVPVAVVDLMREHARIELLDAGATLVRDDVSAIHGHVCYRYHFVSDSVLGQAVVVAIAGHVLRFRWLAASPTQFAGHLREVDRFIVTSLGPLEGTHEAR